MKEKWVNKISDILEKEGVDQKITDIVLEA